MPATMPAGLRPGDVVVVTGASRGIGAALCRRLADGGAKVGLIARDRELLETVAGGLPTESHVAVADVADVSAVHRALGDIEARLGTVAVLVNNAGHGHWDAVVDTDDAAFRAAVEVNYLATVAATRHVLPDMLRLQRGHIINIASIAGRIGAPFEAAYSASKFAVAGFSEALATEVDGTGVFVSMIHPGPVDTDFTRLRHRLAPKGTPRPVEVEKVVDAVMASIRRPRRNRYVPPWLGLAVAARWIAPAASRFGTARLFAAERRELRRRYQHPTSRSD
jgi:short-subunit dehydrogenase